MDFPNIEEVELIESIKAHSTGDNSYNMNFTNNISAHIHSSSHALYSTWFSMDKIHQIEKDAFPAFFEDPTGEILYKDSRNKIVEEYRNNTKKYLTITECRKIVTCDLNALIKIYAFLKKWGIINYNINVEPIERQIKREIKELKCRCGNEKEPLFFNEDHMVVCNECFIKGHYNSKGESTFYKIEDGVIKFMWEKEEELKLLEGIEKYGDDWKAVANFVGTKNKEQCVLKFLKVEIPALLNKYLQNYKGTPFISTNNPVMSVLSFLCSIVHPSVAAEASKWAIKNYTNKTEELVAMALSSSVYKAQEQKDIEEKKLERLYGVMLEAEIKKIELKMKEFDTLNEEVKKERDNLKKLREEYKAEIEELKAKAHIENTVDEK